MIVSCCQYVKYLMFNMLAKFSKMLLVIYKYYYYSILQFFLKTQFFFN